MTSHDLAISVGAVMRGITRLQVLNKLSNQFVGSIVNTSHNKIKTHDGRVYVHIGQLKEALDFAGSDEDFINKYDQVFSLLRKHGYLTYGAGDRGYVSHSLSLDPGPFIKQYPYWFFSLNSRAHEYVHQFDDDIKLVMYMGMFLTPVRKSWDV